MSTAPPTPSARAGCSHKHAVVNTEEIKRGIAWLLNPTTKRRREPAPSAPRPPPFPPRAVERCAQGGDGQGLGQMPAGDEGPPNKRARLQQQPPQQPQPCAAAGEDGARGDSGEEASEEPAAAASDRLGQDGDERKRKRGRKPTNIDRRCRYCGLVYAHTGDLNKHLRTHTGEKPFSCTHPGCDKAFAVRCNLLRHISTHEPSRGVQCRTPGCNAVCADRSQLREHKRIAHGGQGEPHWAQAHRREGAGSPPFRLPLPGQTR